MMAASTWHCFYAWEGQVLLYTSLGGRELLAGAVLLGSDKGQPSDDWDYLRQNLGH